MHRRGFGRSLEEGLDVEDAGKLLVDATPAKTVFERPKRYPPQSTEETKPGRQIEQSVAWTSACDHIASGLVSTGRANDSTEFSSNVRKQAEN